LHARLISHSQPSWSPTDDTGDLDLAGLSDIQDLVAYCARVSNPTNQINSATTPKLLNYLIKHKHWSPFEMASACIEVETTRDIARQLIRHRSFSFQEFSQRYADIRDLDDNFVIRDARLQDPKNRQNSISVDDKELQMQWEGYQQSVINQAKTAYNWAIENGIAKEQARAVLPEGNTVSRLYVNGTIRSWIHYIELRSANGTQLEHMELAREIACAIAKIYPDIANFVENVTD
jgi:thymidylate synthase (FAD)